MVRAHTNNLTSDLRIWSDILSWDIFLPFISMCSRVPTLSTTGCCSLRKVVFHPSSKSLFSIQLSLILWLGNALFLLWTPTALCTSLNEALPIVFLMFMAYLSSWPDHVLRTRVCLIHLFISDSNCVRTNMTFIWFISISNESITVWKHSTSCNPDVGLRGSSSFSLFWVYLQHSWYTWYIASLSITSITCLTSAEERTHTSSNCTLGVAGCSFAIVMEQEKNLCIDKRTSRELTRQDLWIPRSIWEELED